MGAYAHLHVSAHEHHYDTWERVYGLLFFCPPDMRIRAPARSKIRTTEAQTFSEVGRPFPWLRRLTRMPTTIETEATYRLTYADVCALVMAADEDVLPLADAWLSALSEESTPVSSVTRW